jgi:hypothetical protein
LGDQAAKAMADGPDENVVDEELIEEHLRDSVAGSLKLKRYMEGDTTTEDDIGVKRQRLGNPERDKDVQRLLVKWNLHQDAASRYTLKQLTEDEWLHVSSGIWKGPDLYNQTGKWLLTACEQIRQYGLKHKEKNGPGGGAVDSVKAFCFRWSLDVQADKFLRSLSHKDLRHVISSYDGSTTLEELAQESAGMDPEVGTTAGTVPEAPGPLALGRFLRLEMIDPLADALICGDANLTFSLKLARHRKALCHCGRVVATTFENLATLKERYSEIEDTIKELEEHFAEVWHGVDATRLAVDIRFQGHEDSFGKIEGGSS